MRLPHLLSALLCLLLLLAACGPVTTPAAEEAAPESAMADDAMADDAMAEDAMAEDATTDEDTAMESHEDEMAEGEMAEGEAADEEMAMDSESETSSEASSETEAMADEPPMELPAWQQIALTDVRTGESFTLGDFAGKTVFVEPMATWCTNCRQQLGTVKQVREQLGGDDVVFIGISVETNLSAEQLAQYQESTGYDWPFAVATPELVQALVDQFGQSITNPPSTPHFIIRPDGSATELDTGMESADELIAQINEAQG